MNKEQLIAKKVKHQFNGKETLFSVDSLNEHFKGLQIHESDILTDEFEDQDEGYVRVGDINFDFAIANEVVEEVDSETMLTTFPEPIYTIGIDPYEEGNTDGMSFEEAEVILNKGSLVALPEWEGFWFKDLTDGKLLVFTKDNDILDNPHDEYKLRTDWIEVKATPEQELVLGNYFNPKKPDAIVVNDPVVETGKEENKGNVEQKTTSRKNFETKTTNKK